MNETYYGGEYEINYQFFYTMLAVAGILALVQIISLWKIFQKAGKPLSCPLWRRNGINSSIPPIRCGTELRPHPAR